MKCLNKKAEAAATLLIIIVVVLAFGWLINISQRECKKNSDCGSDYYCGSDFSCHQYPNIQKTVVNYNFFWPSIIIAIAILLAVLIIKLNNLEKTESVPEETSKEPKEVGEMAEPYYKSDEDIRTP